MKYFIFLLAVTFTTISNRKSFYPAKLELSNGTIKSGLSTVPSNIIKSGALYFKKSNEDKPEKISAKEVKSISFLKNGQSYTFERYKTKLNYKLFKGKTGSRTSKKAIWVFRKLHHEKLSYYIAAQKYKIVKDGVEFISSGQVGFTTIDYLLKRPNEESVTLITSKVYATLAQEKTFRNYASIYFKDDAELEQRIKNKEFKKSQLEEIYHIYISK